MLLLQPMDLGTLFTCTLIILSHKDHNDTTHPRRWEFYIHFRQQTHRKGSCLPPWVAGKLLIGQKLSGKRKFFCPAGKVHTVKTKEIQPARSVLNNYWTSLADVVTGLSICIYLHVLISWTLKQYHVYLYGNLTCLWLRKNWTKDRGWGGVSEAIFSLLKIEILP